MVSLVLGICAFGLFFVYDVNSFTHKNRFLHRFFGIGMAMLLVSAGLDVFYAVKNGAFSGICDTVLILLGILNLGVLIYCLFFALPFEKTYVLLDEHKVYDRGVYALCRHPGILFFFGTYLFLGLAALPEKMLLNGMIFSFLNFLYACFQDRVTFMKTFSDYGQYRKRVPFLIPNIKSTKRALKTLLNSDSKEDDQ